MVIDFKKKKAILAWQALFLILGASWLWASYFNPGLSNRSSLISQYETPHQPYSWLFRICDIAAGLLVLLAANYYLKTSHKKTAGVMLGILSIGLIADPILTTNCRVVAGVCHEYLSFNFVLHAAETIITAAVFLIAGIYDARQRKKVVSIAFVLFQIAYGILFLSQLADQEHFNTVSQYLYQTVLLVWLAWFVRDYSEDKVRNAGADSESSAVKLFTACWAFLNGLLAIVISLAHLNLLGRISGVYFTSDNAWLAQHGMIIGVVMLYLSRHLARGERRARQIFLLIIGIEVIKYSVISPHGGLLAFYLATFIGLFISKDSFSRGAMPLTWRLRLKDLVFMIGSLLAAMFALLVALDRDNRASLITSRALDNFFDYIAANDPIPNNHISSVLLAHSFSAFLVTAIIAILWILFRPNKIGLNRGKDYGLVKQMLSRYSASSEDFFKLWPPDKNFYWDSPRSGFVAYKIMGSTAFALADPVAPDKSKLTEEFNNWCRSRRLKACFLPVYEPNRQMYESAGLEIIQIGSSAEINIADFLAGTIKEKWWRWKLNRAEKSGYRYSKSIPPHTNELMRGLKTVSGEWLAVGGHSERGFALGYYDNWYLQQCTVHYLTDKTGKITAFTNQLPQFKPSETATVDFLRYTPDANDSMPFLLCNVIQDIAQTTPDAEIFDLGFVPFAKAKGPLLTIARAFSRDRFSSRGLEQFKNKFKPEWQPNYMAYEGDLADLAVIALSIEKVMEQ